MVRRTGSVLVVDDDALNRKLLTRSLENDGHVVRSAENGLEALELLETEPTDVVLLDILMPELDGFEVLRRMKEDVLLRHIPVIMISGVEDIESIVRCIEMGAEDYLPKPFDPVILRARVNAGLSRKQLHDLERDRVRDVFSRFLPESVVDEVLIRTDGEPRLGGERMTGTVMFSDLRGFTTFAEVMAAEQVIDVLNHYLSQMSDAVLDNGGTLVAYLGDGMMSAFGAPIETEDHADRALRAAREMVVERLPRFNDWLRTSGLAEDGFRMGVGLNSGPVMSGNVGSARRLEYAVIGDTVNTASRIESMTKDVPYAVLLADATRESLRDPPDDLVFVDEFEIRGKQIRTKLWGLGRTDRQGGTTA
jgi:adenylate cyclase